MKCIFCDCELGGETRPEHVLLSALGGKKTTRVAICTGHNEMFGGTIDRQVAEQVAVLRNHLQLESGTGKPPPMLRRLEAGEETINIRGDGELELVAQPFKVTLRDDGNLDIQITARTPDELAKIIPHLAAYLKVPKSEVEKIVEASEATVISKRPGRIHHRLSFGGPDALRSLTKSSLVLWTLRVGNDEVKSPKYKDARDFVLLGGEHFNRQKIRLDSRYLPSHDELVRRFGPFFNLIYVASSGGRVVAHFTLYNIIGWRIVLAEAGAPEGLAIGLVSNPLTPSEWSDSIADELPIDFAWLDSPDYSDDFVRSRERLTAAVRHYSEMQGQQQIHRIISEVFKKNGIVGDDQPVADPHVLQRIKDEVSHRLALHILNLPHEERLKREQIRSLLEELKGRKA